ncbi:hypothetical protein RSSM_05592 [Rhodopirellula sallentina SM41]|uniref:Uncharacterized protein n=1 Tax=Rhodopirellula sallentina SM41 TaxID=1263870 RepID=M5TV90_9BACT|nr:hypothetical protein RSSM_05592 [Rhodopirellula sallentina SM41]
MLLTFGVQEEGGLNEAGRPRRQANRHSDAVSRHPRVVRRRKDAAMFQRARGANGGCGNVLSKALR